MANIFLSQDQIDAVRKKMGDLWVNELKAAVSGVLDDPDPVHSSSDKDVRTFMTQFSASLKSLLTEDIENALRDIDPKGVPADSDAQDLKQILEEFKSGKIDFDDPMNKVRLQNAWDKVDTHVQQSIQEIEDGLNAGDYGKIYQAINSGYVTAWLPPELKSKVAEVKSQVAAIHSVNQVMNRLEKDVVPLISRDNLSPAEEDRLKKLADPQVLPNLHRCLDNIENADPANPKTPKAYRAAKEGVDSLKIADMPDILDRDDTLSKDTPTDTYSPEQQFDALNQQLADIQEFMKGQPQDDADKLIQQLREQKADGLFKGEYGIGKDPKLSEDKIKTVDCQKILKTGTKYLEQLGNEKDMSEFILKLMTNSVFAVLDMATELLDQWRNNSRENRIAQNNKRGDWIRDTRKAYGIDSPLVLATKLARDTQKWLFADPDYDNMSALDPAKFAAVRRKRDFAQSLPRQSNGSVDMGRMTKEQKAQYFGYLTMYARMPAYYNYLCEVSGVKIRKDELDSMIGHAKKMSGVAMLSEKEEERLVEQKAAQKVAVNRRKQDSFIQQVEQALASGQKELLPVVISGGLDDAKVRLKDGTLVTPSLETLERLRKMQKDLLTRRAGVDEDQAQLKARQILLAQFRSEVQDQALSYGRRKRYEYENA